MKLASLKRRLKGLTLIETMISSTILLLISGASYMILHNGMQLYRAYQDALDAQQGGLAILRLTGDLVRSSSSAYVLADPTDGVTFCNPYKPDGRMGYDIVMGSPTEGKLYWQAYTCIYRNQATNEVLRKDEPLAAPQITPLDPSSAAPVRDVAYFTTLGVTKRILGKGVTRFVVKIDPTAAALSKANTYIIELTLGDINDTSRYGLVMTSQVTPAN